MTDVLPIPSLLVRLVEDGNAILTRRPRGHIDEVRELVAAVEHYRKAPVDQKRVVDERTWLYAQALLGAQRALDPLRPDLERAVAFCRVVAVLIDDVREQWQSALEQSRRPTP